MVPKQTLGRLNYFLSVILCFSLLQNIFLVTDEIVKIGIEKDLR